MNKPFQRRTLIKWMPALAAAGLLDAQDAGAPASAIGIETLQQALKVAGLAFTDEQLTLMLPVVNRALTSYTELRKKDVPLDTEPATRFIPLLPGKKVRSGLPRFHPTFVTPPPRPADLEDLAFAPVTQLAALVRARRVSSVDLTQMYLARLRTYGPKLNCVITLTEDLAIEQARQADHQIRRGRYFGPLHGIPWGAKDLFNTQGIATTWGAEPYQDQVPTYDATVVERLRKAGAVLVAKLSMGVLAQGDLWFRGRTNNPWNTEQGSSGSSAGSAAATSAGLVGFALGTETLGSIVSPSTRCGVVGVRPTYGRVSRYGAMGLSWTMDKVGPICRTVEDCALVLRAIYGPDGHDLTVLDVPFDWMPRTPLSRLKIGILQTEFDRRQGEAKEVYSKAVEALKGAGATLEPVELPTFPTQPLRIILEAEAATAFDDLTRNGGVNQLKGQTASDWPNSFRSSRMIPAVEYIRAQRARTLLMRDMDTFMSQWDVIVSPTQSATLLITNLTGHPQVAVPCGFVNKSPASLLFTGRLYEEGTPMRAAMAFEHATDWHKHHPTLAT